MAEKNKGSHLTLEDRKIIERGIESGSTKTAIAMTIGKDNSTVGKEISLHRVLAVKCSLQLECSAYKKCKRGRACKPDCPSYVPFKCTRRDRSPGACNGCSNYSRCRFDKYRYDAAAAQAAYEKKLVESRVGVDMTYSEAKEKAEIIGPLLKQGLSPFAIVQAHPELDLSERTLYNYLDADLFEQFGFGVIDLRRKVGRKITKKKSATYKKREDRRFLQGRLYTHYREFIADNPDASVVQMDTVYNDVSNGPFVQTFKFISLPFFFAVFHTQKTAAAMLSGINLLEDILTPQLFSKYVQVILTDRGSEFSCAEAAELRPDGTRRTRIFYCDPMQSAQKGSLENNHIELRYIRPNGADLFALGLTSQNALNLICSHLNSYPKEKNRGKTNFECLQFFAPDLFQRFLDYGLSVIPADQVILKPYLIRRFVK